MGRIFDLDWQLLQDSVLLAFNVFVLFLALSYVLFHPVRAVLQERKDRIGKEIEEAERMKRESAQMHAEYEERIAHVGIEVQEKLKEAEHLAAQRRTFLLEEAKAEAEEIRERARKEARQEREREEEERRQQIIHMAALLAVKLVAEKLDEEMQQELIQKGLKEMRDRAWQIQ